MQDHRPEVSSSREATSTIVHLTLPTGPEPSSLRQQHIGMQADSLRFNPCNETDAGRAGDIRITETILLESEEQSILH